MLARIQVAALAVGLGLLMGVAAMPHYALVQTSAPAAEPLSLADAKAWLRIDADDATQDDVLYKSADGSGLLPEARERFERYTGRQVITATWRLDLDWFPGYAAPGLSRVNADWYASERGWDELRTIRLFKSPVQSLTKIEYLDTAGALQTLAGTEYLADLASQPPRLAPAYGKIWPVAYPVQRSVRVTYVAGYGDAAANVPADVRGCLKRIVGLLYGPRGDDADPKVHEAVESAIQTLCSPFWTGEMGA